MSAVAVSKLIVWACLALSGGLVTLDILQGRATARVLLVCVLLSAATIAVIWS